MAYSASKGAVVGMTLPMARDLASLGVRVCAVAPGVFETPMMAGASEELQAALAATIPCPKRLGRPAEFGKLVGAILENPPECAAFIFTPCPDHTSAASPLA